MKKTTRALHVPVEHVCGPNLYTILNLQVRANINDFLKTIKGVRFDKIDSEPLNCNHSHKIKLVDL